MRPTLHSKLIGDVPLSPNSMISEKKLNFSTTFSTTCCQKIFPVLPFFCASFIIELGERGCRCVFVKIRDEKSVHVIDQHRRLNMSEIHDFIKFVDIFVDGKFGAKIYHLRRFRCFQFWTHLRVLPRNFDKGTGDRRDRSPAAVISHTEIQSFRI